MEGGLKMDESGKTMLKSLSLDDLKLLKKDINEEINTRLERMISAYGGKP